MNEHSSDAALAPELLRLSDHIKTTAANGGRLHIVGGGSKQFVAVGEGAERLSVSELSGIVSYEPTELVLTARAGTTLNEINAVLSEHNQMLGFEPPQLSAASTLGGVIAAGWSGPARPYRGSARDFVLGAQLINGHGQVLRFGGQVMKNVAGYDIARLLAGGWGALGVITEVSVRVVPRPSREATLCWRLSMADARERMLELASEPWPITAMCADVDELAVRISGSAEAVVDAVARLKPERLEDDDQRWSLIRDMRHPDLTASGDDVLWRLSLPPAAADPELPVKLQDWGGAQRWLIGSASNEELHLYCAALGGHATLLDRRGEHRRIALAEPEPALKALMLRIKQAFDPAGVFNPGYYFGWM